LDTFEKIKRFINVANRLDCELDLISGRYVVDGKSIMGIFSLDLSNPIEVRIISQNSQVPEELDEFKTVA
jgi:Phosphotransferase system, HPr-related proteins